MRGLSPFYIPKMPSGCSSCISCRFQPLSTTYGQIAHVLLTRSPLGHLEQALLDLVRLACIRHAASVHPEPGSNSPFAHLFLNARAFGFFVCVAYSLLGIDVSCSVFKDRFPRLAAPPLSARLYYHPLPFPSSCFFLFFCFFSLFLSFYVKRGHFALFHVSSSAIDRFSAHDDQRTCRHHAHQRALSFIAFSSSLTISYCFL